jgi:hypothetical protein
MLRVERLTRGLGLAAVNTGCRAAASRPAPAIVLPDERTPVKRSTAIDLHHVGDLRFGGARVRERPHIGLAMRMGRPFWYSRMRNVVPVHPARARAGVLDHLQEPARAQQCQAARCRMWPC